ncbi:MAG TPA: hypothetical protein P5081_18740 [Phycisphaerae bacterium]|nr:hypothetical protein [Phycisphaerae bacterium]HRW54910.1 hypothetical protein [Phycisphaerae bacterium]
MGIHPLAVVGTGRYDAADAIRPASRHAPPLHDAATSSQPAGAGPRLGAGDDAETVNGNCANSWLA